MPKKEKKKNKLILFSLSTSLLFCNYGYAQSNKPTVFKNGISANASIINDSGVSQGTIGDVANKALGSVQQTDANQPNGYAKLDENQNVTSPLLNNTRVGGSDTGTDISNALVNSAGTSNSVAQWMGKKVDVTNGVLDAPTLTGASLDLTSKVNGISIANPTWMGFLTSSVTWTVCASGCLYTDPMVAWKAAMAAQTFGPQKITISVADGTYNITDQFESAAPSGAFVSLIGNTTDNSRVVFNFTNIKGTNHHGFYAHDGGNIGLVDGITMNGVDAIISATETGITWNKDSYGAGFYAFGPSRINLGAHLAINRFYYSVLADDGGFVSAPHGGVTATYGGDVNFLARHNGVIDCEGCSASYVADTTWSGATLGCNYMAEDGGEINVIGSTGQYSLVGAVCARTGGHGWASKFTGKGGLGGRVGNGLDVRENGTISAGNSTYTGYAIGAWVQLGAYANVDSCTFSNNKNDGILISSFGKVEGNDVTLTGNGGFGVHLMGQSSAIMYNTLAKDTGNTDGAAFVEGAGTENGYAYNASSLYLQ